MKTLPIKLSKNGSIYTQIHRGERSCVYERREPEGDVYYEVFLIKNKPDRKIRGKLLEAKEVYPHNEAFGVWAWINPNYESTMRCFQELESGIRRKNTCHPNSARKIQTC